MEETDSIVDCEKMGPSGDGVSASKSEMAARLVKMDGRRRVYGGARDVMEKRMPLLDII